MNDFINTTEAKRIIQLIEDYQDQSQQAYNEYLDAEFKVEELQYEYNQLEDEFENE